MEAIADVMVVVGAGRMAEARSMMGKLLAWRDTFYDAELAEARAIKADRTANWTEMRDAASAALELDEEQLGAMRGILNRVLGDETVTIWLDTYRGLGFEAMLRRSAAPSRAFLGRTTQPGSCAACRADVPRTPRSRRSCPSGVRPVSSSAFPPPH